MKIAGAFLGLVVVLCIGLLIGQQWIDEPVQAVNATPINSDLIPIEKRQPAPNFELVDLFGVSHRLSNYKGQVVFLNFWATWCGPCKIEAPALQRLYQSMDGEDFELLAVSTDHKKEPINPFVEQYKLTFPVLWDQEQEVAKRYQVAGIPISLLIDRQGRVAARVMGAREWDSAQWQNTVRGLLAE